MVGGYRFDTAVNVQQKNSIRPPAILPGGATVETPIGADLLHGQNQLVFLLKDADFTTAERVAQGINATGRRAISPTSVDAEAVTGDTRPDFERRRLRPDCAHRERVDRALRTHCRAWWSLTSAPAPIVAGGGVQHLERGDLARRHQGDGQHQTGASPNAFMGAQRRAGAV